MNGNCAMSEILGKCKLQQRHQVERVLKLQFAFDSSSIRQLDCDRLTRISICDRRLIEYETDRHSRNFNTFTFVERSSASKIVSNGVRSDMELPL
jgi:hypothetical protein